MSMKNNGKACIGESLSMVLITKTDPDPPDPPDQWLNKTRITCSGSWRKGRII